MLSHPGNGYGIGLGGILPGCLAEPEHTWLRYRKSDFSSHTCHRQKVQGIDCPCRWEKVGQTNPRGSGEDTPALKDQQGVPSSEWVRLEGGCPRGTENLKSNLSRHQYPGWPKSRGQLEQRSGCKDYYQGKIEIVYQGGMI